MPDFRIITGTTGLAAAELGRNFVGIELNPESVAIANERFRMRRSA
jgi:DNA modification methylase